MLPQLSWFAFAYKLPRSRFGNIRRRNNNQQNNLRIDDLAMTPTGENLSTRRPTHRLAYASTIPRSRTTGQLNNNTITYIVIQADANPYLQWTRAHGSRKRNRGTS
jgi:hypothetical protein